MSYRSNPVQRRKLRNVALLWLPAILGTGFFLAGVILSELEYFRSAPAISWDREPSLLERVQASLVETLYLACYFGAAFGPYLLPLAGLEAFTLTRAVGLRSKATIWVWIFLVVGISSAALFWGWLVHLDIFV